MTPSKKKKNKQTKNGAAPFSLACSVFFIFNPSGKSFVVKHKNTHFYTQCHQKMTFGVSLARHNKSESERERESEARVETAILF